MIKEVIFESYRGGVWWRKILCKIFCHLWSRIIDIQIGETEEYRVTMIIWKCVDCKINQFWVLKENKTPNSLVDE